MVTHASEALYTRGLRSFFEYWDLGIKRATAGHIDAHVIRAAAGKKFSSQAHLHRTTFQMVYVLKGWIEFEYEGHSSDVEMLEIVMPADFNTVEVAAVEG